MILRLHHRIKARFIVLIVLWFTALPTCWAANDDEVIEFYRTLNSDTIPGKPPVKIFTDSAVAKLIKIKPPKEKNFIKLLLSAFKFKVNADANERLRINALIDTLRIDANLGILIENIKLLEQSMVFVEDSLVRLKFYVDSLAHLNDSMRKEWNFVIDSITKAYNRRQADDSKFLADHVIRVRIYNINKILASLKVRTRPDETGNDQEFIPSTKLKKEDPYSGDSTLCKVIPEFNTDTVPVMQKKVEYWFDRFTRYISLYGYIINNPCATCFKQTGDSTRHERYGRYINELGIDTNMQKENIALLSKKKKPFKTHYAYVNHLLTQLLGKITFALFLLLAIFASFYFFKTKFKGNEWNGKKAITYTSVAISYLFIISLLSYSFCNGNLPYVGVRPSIGPTNVSYYSEKYGSVENLEKLKMAEQLSIPDPACNGISLLPFLFYVSVVLLILYLTMAPLIQRLFKKNEMP